MHAKQDMSRIGKYRSQCPFEYTRMECIESHSNYSLPQQTADYHLIALFCTYIFCLFFFSQGTLCACAACNGNKTSLVDRMTIFVHVLVQSTIQNNLQMINLSISFYSEANTIDRLTEFVRNVNFFFFVNSMLRSIYIVQAFSQYATVHVYRSRNRGSKKMIIKAENKYDSK